MKRTARTTRAVRLPRDAGTLIYEIGRAVTVWQHLENSLGMLFCDLVGEGDKSGGPARAAYCSVLNLGIRTDMVNAAMRAVIKDADVLRAWAEIYSGINQKANLRNRIVHSSMVEDRRARTKGYWLAPSPVDEIGFEKARIGAGRQADANQIYLWTLSFDELHVRLADFHKSIEHHCNK